MSALVSPIHVGTLNGKPLRFFKAPFNEPHLPWHAWDDLMVHAHLSPDLRQRMHAAMKQEFGRDTRTIATTAGIVTIASHGMAQGFLGWMAQSGRAPSTIEFAYSSQAVDAWDALAGDLPDWASLELMLSAFRSTQELEVTGGAA